MITSVSTLTPARTSATAFQGREKIVGKTAKATIEAGTKAMENAISKDIEAEKVGGVAGWMTEGAKAENSLLSLNEAYDAILKEEIRKLKLKQQ